MRVLVTPRSFASTSKKPREILEEKGYEIIYNNKGRPIKKKEMLEMVTEIDGIIIGIDPFDADIIGRAQKLKVISKYGVGVDNIDLSAAEKKGITVCNTPGANTDAVADLAFGLMLALARRIPEADRETKAGNWKKIVGNSVYGKTLGVIGLGKIGRSLVKRAQGFEMDILAHDICRDNPFARKHDIKYVDMDRLLKESDYISIHTPLNKETRNMIAAEELYKMKDSAFLINTSRGGIVDEEDLYQALSSENLKGAALDAFVCEPPDNSPLRNLDNVIMTSHNGSYTEEAIASMGIKAAQNLIDVLEGRKPENKL
ncbi:MAG: phosphoglycerate dehydrogenase [Halanaerobiales bacterium]